MDNIETKYHKVSQFKKKYKIMQHKIITQNSSRFILQCLEESFIRQSLGLLNCTPPWMTENENLWCQNVMNLTRDQESEVEILLSNIINERGKEGKCFPSCKTAWYLEF